METKCKPQGPHREVFILRYWREAGGQRSLRGQIQDTRSGLTFPIQSPEILFSLIQEQMEKAGKKGKTSGIK